MANPMFHEWALSKPVHTRLSLSTGTGFFVIRRLGEGIFLAPCPGCEEWLNIPISGVDRKSRGAYDSALYGTLDCIFCETRMVIKRELAQVKKLGNPKKRRKPVDRRPQERKPPVEKAVPPMSFVMASTSAVAGDAELDVDLPDFEEEEAILALPDLTDAI